MSLYSFKVEAIGAATGVVLTGEALERLNVRAGDTVYLTEASDGGYRLTSVDPERERQMALAEVIMHEDRDILRALAK